MKIKPIHKLDTDELQKQLTKKNNRIYTTNTNISFFISHYNIRKGNYLVGIRLLYRLYKHWSSEKISYSKFRVEIKNYFLIYKADYIHISLDSLNITRETAKFLIQEEASEIKHSKAMEDFITFNDLQEGTAWVPVNLLYRVCVFQFQLLKGNTLRITTKEFTNYLKLHFQYAFTDKHLFRLTEVNNELLKKEEQRIAEWKKEQTSKNKVRRAKTRIKLKNTLQ